MPQSTCSMAHPRGAVLLEAGVVHVRVSVVLATSARVELDGAVDARREGSAARRARSPTSRATCREQLTRSLTVLSRTCLHLVAPPLTMGFRGLISMVFFDDMGDDDESRVPAFMMLHVQGSAVLARHEDARRARSASRRRPCRLCRRGPPS